MFWGAKITILRIIPAQEHLAQSSKQTNASRRTVQAVDTALQLHSCVSCGPDREFVREVPDLEWLASKGWALHFLVIHLTHALYLQSCKQRCVATK